MKIGSNRMDSEFKVFRALIASAANTKMEKMINVKNFKNGTWIDLFVMCESLQINAISN